jgi:hypothetical protein
MQEMQAALARWREADRRMLEAVPGSRDHAVAQTECRDAQAEYERLLAENAARLERRQAAWETFSP